jgi:Spy/CpxP family protein refolding chaperone
MKLLNHAMLIAALVIALPVGAQTKGAAPAAADKGTMNMDILREKVKADKKLIVAQNMKLTDAEAKAFWPVYDAYQKDLQSINDRMMTAIKAYADVYNKGAVSNEAAKKLLNEALAIEEAELKLKRAYVPKLEKAVPDVKVALYMQIENKIRALVRFELAANIPLVE